MSLYDAKHKNLVEKLKTARIEADISQEELAKKLDRTQSFISKLENGQVKVDAILLNELAQIFRKNINYFLGSKNATD